MTLGEGRAEICGKLRLAARFSVAHLSFEHGNFEFAQPAIDGSENRQSSGLPLLHTPAAADIQHETCLSDEPVMPGLLANEIAIALDRSDCFVSRLGTRRHRGEPTALEEAEECIIVALRDRIELVIVAASALETDPEHGTAEKFNPFVQLVHQYECLGRDFFERPWPIERHGRGQGLIDRVILPLVTRH